MDLNRPCCEHGPTGKGPRRDGAGGGFSLQSVRAYSSLSELSTVTSAREWSTRTTKGVIARLAPKSQYLLTGGVCVCVHEDMCVDASGALPLRDQRVPCAPQVGTRSGPAPPATRHSCSSSNLPSTVRPASTRAGEEASLICIDELWGTFYGTVRPQRGLRPKPRPPGVEITAARWHYTTCLPGVDRADALLPLHDCVRSSLCADVLR